MTAKDITLSVIGATGTAGGTGYVIEYCGEAIRDLSMEGRMTVCNMAIEGGARAGLIAPDEKTYAYVQGPPACPKGAEWEAALAYWKTCSRDDDAHWDKVLTFKGEDIAPVVTWGTSPEDVLPITGVSQPRDFQGGKVEARSASLDYMGLTRGHQLTDIADRHGVHRVLHQRPDRRPACRCRILKGKKVKDGMRAMVVPGSGLVRAQAEEEGLADSLSSTPDSNGGWRAAPCAWR